MRFGATSFEEDYDFVKEQVQKQLTSFGSDVSYVYRIQTKEGVLKYLQHLGKQTVDEEGRITSLYGSIQDITERKLAEKSLRESEERYREIFNATSDALLIHDVSGNVLDVNRRMCELFNCTREVAPLVAHAGI